jgi:hypothetical protein
MTQKATMKLKDHLINKYTRADPDLEKIVMHPSQDLMTVLGDKRHFKETDDFLHFLGVLDKKKASRRLQIKQGKATVIEDDEPSTALTLVHRTTSPAKLGSPGSPGSLELPSIDQIASDIQTAIGLPSGPDSPAPPTESASKVSSRKGSIPPAAARQPTSPPNPGPVGIMHTVLESTGNPDFAKVTISAQQSRNYFAEHFTEASRKFLGDGIQLGLVAQNKGELHRLVDRSRVTEYDALSNTYMSTKMVGHVGTSFWDELLDKVNKRTAKSAPLSRDERMRQRQLPPDQRGRTEPAKQDDELSGLSDLSDNLGNLRVSDTAVMLYNRHAPPTSEQNSPLPTTPRKKARTRDDQMVKRDRPLTTPSRRDNLGFEEWLNKTVDTPLAKIASRSLALINDKDPEASKQAEPARCSERSRRSLKEDPVE